MIEITGQLVINDTDKDQKYEFVLQERGHGQRSYNYLIDVIKNLPTEDETGHYSANYMKRVVLKLLEDEQNL